MRYGFFHVDISCDIFSFSNAEISCIMIPNAHEAPSIRWMLVQRGPKRSVESVETGKEVLMNKIGIVTDSNSGLKKEEAEELQIKVLAMPFYFEETCYYEDITITREEFFEKMDAGLAVQTSQPSPEMVQRLWDEALQEYEQILYFPISSGLSGSYMTAMVMSQQEEYEGKVFVVDDGRVSTPLLSMLLDAIDLIEKGLDAEEIRGILEEQREKMSVYIAMGTLEYLKRGGRIDARKAALGNLLNIKPILSLGTGTFDVYKKSRGSKRAHTEMIEAIRNDLNTRFAEEYRNGNVRILVATSADECETNAWIQEVKEAFPGMEVLSGYLSLGACCHIGPGALGIGCACKPQL